MNVNDLDIVCLSETFLDSSIPIDDNRLSIPGYSMMRADHPSNTKRSEVCLYYKEHFLIIWRDDISNLKEFLVTEITIKMNDVSSRAYIGLLAKIVNSFSPFVNNINSLNPAISIITGDFNGKCSKW